MPDTTAMRVFHNRESRILAKAALDAAEVPQDADGVPSGGLLPPPGSIVVYVGRTTSPAWQAVRRRIAERDWQALADSPLRPRQPEQPFDPEALERADVCFEIRHAGRTIMRDVALPDELDHGTLTFPYTGGDVDDADFEVVEYLRTSDAARTLSYAMLRRAPELTSLEAELLGKLPPELRELHVSPREPCGDITSMDDITNSLGRAAQCAVDQKHGMGGCYADFATMRLTDELVEQIAGRGGEPAASVRELMAVRRGLLGR